MIWTGNILRILVLGKKFKLIIFISLGIISVFNLEPFGRIERKRFTTGKEFDSVPKILIMRFKAQIELRISLIWHTTK